MFSLARGDRMLLAWLRAWLLLVLILNAAFGDWHYLLGGGFWESADDDGGVGEDACTR